MPPELPRLLEDLLVYLLADLILFCVGLFAAYGHSSVAAVRVVGVWAGGVVRVVGQPRAQPPPL